MFFSKSLYFYVSFLRIFSCRRIFFSPAAEFLGRAGRKILERGGNTAWCTHFFLEIYGTVLLKNLAAGKNFDSLWKRYQNKRYFAGIDYTGIVLHAKAMLGTRLVWIFTLQNN
jgi:hypothetical protein